MASGSGSGSQRRLMAMSSSLDQHNQQQQQQQQEFNMDQQQQSQRQQQVSPVRRSSAVNFDQATSRLIGQYNQQQISAGAALNQHHLMSGGQSRGGTRPPYGNSAPFSQQQQSHLNQPTSARRGSTNSTQYLIQQPQQLEQKQSDFVGYYYQQPSSNNNTSGQQINSSSNSEESSQVTSNSSQQALARDSGGQLHDPGRRYSHGACQSMGTASGRLTAQVKDQADVVFNRLMALDAFRKLHPTVIRNLCSYASIERIDKGVIVFRQGDDAINWYALLEGSVDVKVSQNGGQKDGVTLCTLGVGTTFGASVMPGKLHSVSVVTSEDCTLLRVRRADFQEIFNEQSHLINDVESSPFCSFTSLNRLSASGDGSSAVISGKMRRRQSQLLQQQQQLQKKQQAAANQKATAANGTMLGGNKQQRDSQSSNQEEEEDAASGCQQQEEELGGEDLNLDTIDPNELSSHLMRIGWVLRTLMLDQSPQMIQNRRIHPNQRHHSHHHKQHQGHRHSASVQQSHPNQPNPQQRKLVSMASSSQLLGGSSSGSSAKSAASAAGRKVASYVAASFLRNSSKQQQPAPQLPVQAAASNNLSSSSSKQGKAVSSSGSLFTSSSIDASELPATSGSASSLAGLNSTNSEPVVFRRCMLGREMVDWLLNLGTQTAGAAAAASRFVGSRLQAISMWQVLLEQGIVFAFTDSDATSGSVPSAATSGPPSYNNNDPQQQNCCQFQFRDDPQAYYKFWFDREGSRQQQSGETSGCLPKPQEEDVELALESVWWSLRVLAKLAPDACFRLILAKRPHERSSEEVDIVFEELQHLKALGHLTNSVKKELAACVMGEHHAKQNTVIFNQGDVGQSWYIILRGSVNVVIVGKGVVCTLHDGDDFGKLALVNDAPRAATIVTNEPNCYFLRVDKHNFNTILRDVEANTVRLKEHGKEVLILQKVPVKEPPGGAQQAAAGSEAQGASGQLDSSSSMTAAASSTGSQFGGQQQDNSINSNGPSSVQSAAAAQQAAAGATSAQQQQPTIGSSGPSTLSSQQSAALKYMVMAGTGEKMLEHLLETRIDGRTQTGDLTVAKCALIQHDQVSAYIQCHGDNFLEDFILTHKIFMPTAILCNELLKQYQCQTKSQLSTNKGSSSSSAQLTDETATSGGSNGAKSQSLGGEDASLDNEYLVAKKRRVVKFIRCWMLITREHFFQQQQIQSFLTTIHQKVKQDVAKFSSLQPELRVVAKILELHLEEELDGRHKGVQRWIHDIYGNILPIRRHSGAWDPQSSHSAQSQPAGGSGSDSLLHSLHSRRFELKLSTIQPDDEVVFRVYCADHSFATLKARLDEKAGEIKQHAARKLNLRDKELILVHVKSNGERIIYNDLESNISTGLSVNGRIFVCPLDHIDAISPLPEQDPFQEAYQHSGASAGGGGGSHNHNNPLLAANGANGQNGTTSSAANSLNNGTNGNNSYDGGQQKQASTFGDSQQQQPGEVTSGSNNNNNNGPTNNNSNQGPISSHLLQCTPTNQADIKTQMGLSVGKLEEFSSRDVAYCLTQLAWSLLRSMHEFELIYTVFGRHNFKQITANLNVFLRHFNEIQYWVVTQICLSTSLSKRVQILRKFIKIAAHCRELQNLNAFFAIIMGLSNMAVARLTQTWERLPNKLKRTFSQFESLIDPSRNHRRYRIFISKMEPPIIPFMPLFLKDMTFAHEGNKTYLENGLINFEKMQMVAQTLRTIRYCKSRPMKLDPSACKFKGSIRSIELFFRDLKIIDNQRTLTQMSHQLEHRKT